MLFQRISLAAIVFGLVLPFCLLSGCQNTALSRRFSQTVGYREANSERENPASQSSDPWIQDVGTMTRKEHGVQPVNDPLNLRKFTMSEKARDIERNLGVGD